MCDSHEGQAGELTDVVITPAMLRAVVAVLSESGWLSREAPEPTEVLALEILTTALRAPH